MPEGLSDHPLPPDAGHKTLMWQVPSLYPKERSLLMEGDGGIPGGPQMTRSCQVFPSLLPTARSLLSYCIYPQLSTLHQA